MDGQFLEQERKKQETRQQVSELFTTKKFHLDVAERGPLTQEQNDSRKMTVSALREAIKNSFPVVIPQEMTEEEKYSGGLAKEILSANKRKRYIKEEGHLLYQKDQNAKLTDEYDNAYAAKMDQVRELALDVEGFSEMSCHEQALVMKLVNSDNLMVTKSRMEEYLDKEKRYDVINTYVQELMTLDLSQIDLSSDKALLSQDKAFRRMGELANGLVGIMKLYSEFKSSMEDDTKALFNEKLDRVKAMADYYAAKKMLITDSYYRTHYNSEVSYVASEEASIEQNTATQKLWMVEAVVARLKVPGMVSKMRARIEDANPESVLELVNNTPAQEPEPGKNVAPPMTARHMQTITEFEEQHPERARELDGQGNMKYRITGDDKSSSESFVRYLHNISWLKASQFINKQEMVFMLENLSARPVDATDMDQVRVCRELNMAGLRTFKSLMKIQINYLSRKYGFGMHNINSEDIAAHSAEFSEDFANMQGFGSMLEYIRTIPELWEPGDELLLKKYMYYSTGYIADAMARNASYHDIPQGRTSFAEYKRTIAYSLVNSEGSDIGMVECVEAVKNEHTKIQWDAVWKLSDVGSVLQNPEEFEKRSKALGKRGDFDPEDWLAYFPELQEAGLSREEIMDKYIREENQPFIEAITPALRKDGVEVGATYIPGMGTDDMLMITGFYDKILRDYKEYDLSEEKAAQFGAILERWRNHAVSSKTYESLANRALEIRDSVNQQDNKGIRGAAAAEFRYEANKAYQRYFDEFQRILREEATVTYNDILGFIQDNGIFMVPEHKEVYKKKVTDEVAKLEPSVEMDLGAIKILVHPVDEKRPDYSVQHFLKGRRLKANTDPEKFKRDVDTVNGLIAQVLTMSKYIDDGRAHEGNFDEAKTFADVPKKKGVFLYELFNRAATYVDRFVPLLNSLKDRTEKI